MKVTSDILERFWNKDATLWSQDPGTQAFIRQFMGWIDISKRMQGQVHDLREFAETIWAEGFTDVLVCGMGGSSLGSLVLRDVFSHGARVHLHVLDSTDPETILSLRKNLPLESTLFLVASKSGTTIEPKSFEDFFWEEASASLGEMAGEHFVAITDPGSEMEAEAKRRGYRRIFLGDPEVGGRFSVLSVFGLVSAALLGADIEKLLDSATEFGPESTSGLALDLAQFLIDNLEAKRDKVTLLSGVGLESLGLWVEQLVAESTGKDGKGILPVAGEPIGRAEDYGADRCFVVTRWDDGRGDEGNVVAQDLAKRGRPVFEITLGEPDQIGKVFFAWEVATALLAIALNVNPFDQPNVQSAKEIAKAKLAEFKGMATPSMVKPEFRFEGAADLFSFLEDRKPGTYVAFLGYLPESDATTAEFDRIRLEVREKTGFVTTFGYGPRYLHSTGQYHKGGPNNGVFVLVLAADSRDTIIPNIGASFGQLKLAQARGDLGALKDAGRDVLVIYCRDPSDLQNVAM